MSKNEHWLPVFMALGANLKISIFDPPSVGGTYNLILAQAMARLAAPMHTNVLTFWYLIIWQLEGDCRYLNGQDV